MSPKHLMNGGRLVFVALSMCLTGFTTLLLAAPPTSQTSVESPKSYPYQINQQSKIPSPNAHAYEDCLVFMSADHHWSPLPGQHVAGAVAELIPKKPSPTWDRGQDLPEPVEWLYNNATFPRHPVLTGGDGLLRKWVKNSQLGSGGHRAQGEEAVADELRVLRREVSLLREENNILKQAWQAFTLQNTCG